VWEERQHNEEEVVVTNQTQSNYDREEVCKCDACGVEKDDDFSDTEEVEFDKAPFPECFGGYRYQKLDCMLRCHTWGTIYRKSSQGNS